MLQRLQNGALQLILDAQKDTSVDLMHTQLNLDYLIKRRKKHTCYQVYKVANDLSPENLKNIIWKPTTQCRMKLRSRNLNLLEVPVANLELTRRGFHYRGPKVWNGIEEDIKNEETLKSFKRALNCSSQV